MKTYKLIILFFLTLLTVGCEDEPVLYDFEQYKFASFIDKEYTIKENYSKIEIEEGNDPRFPIYLQYDGSVLEEDFTAELGVTENLALEGVDYTIESTTVLFKAGSIRSEPIYLTLIDNVIEDADQKSLILTIESTSNSNVEIGVGIVNQANKELLIIIADNDDSCLANYWSGEGVSVTDVPFPSYSPSSVESVKIDCSHITVTFEFWGSSTPPMVFELELGAPDPTTFIGSVTLLNDVVTNSYGYDVKFSAGDAGTYDLNSGTINLDPVFEGYGGYTSYPFLISKD